MSTATRQFLHPDEVIMVLETELRPIYMLVKRNSPPKTRKAILDGIRAHWTRVEEFLTDDVKKTVEIQMNSELEAQGATERVKFKDNSYLNLIDPNIADSGATGQGPKLFQDAIPMWPDSKEMTVVYEPNSPELKNPEETAAEMSQVFQDPLYTPEI